MDNNNLSKIPVSELTPDNYKSLKGDSEPELNNTPEPTRRHNIKGRLPLIITGAILIIAVAVALFFIFRQPSEAPTSSGDENEGQVVEPTWEPEPESEDPTGDYVKHHQSIVDDPETNADEKLNAKLSIANVYSATDDFTSAESTLNEIDRTNLTPRQLFNLYSAYAYLYYRNGNEAAYQEYSLLVDEALGTYWEEGDDSAATPATEEE